jgi:hypothetical protein
MPTRVGCAARLLYRDRHRATARPWVLIDPDGQEYHLCSQACLLEIVCEGPPTELEPRPAPAPRRHLELVR